MRRPAHWSRAARYARYTATIMALAFARSGLFAMMLRCIKCQLAMLSWVTCLFSFAVLLWRTVQPTQLSLPESRPRWVYLLSLAVILWHSIPPAQLSLPEG